MSALASGRITASDIGPGSVIVVEINGAGNLVPTRRKRGTVTVKVSGKDFVAVDGGTQRRYVIFTTDGRQVEPAPGAQTFTVGDPSDVVDPAPAPADVPAGAPVNPAELWRNYETAREFALAGDQDAPTRTDMKPRTETFRGRRLKVTRDSSSWGTLAMTVNGAPAGGTTGNSAAAMDRAAEQLRKDVLAADERNVTDPDAFPAVWFDGAEPLPAAIVDYVRYRAEEDTRERAALAATTCTDTAHVPGTMGCPISFPTCNGVPFGAHTITVHQVTTPQVGFDEVGAELRNALASTLPDVGQLSTGETRWDHKRERRAAVWQIPVSGHLVTFVHYSARTALADECSYVAVLIDGRMVAGNVNAAQRSAELCRFLAWIVSEALAKPAAADQAPAPALTTVPARGGAERAPVVVAVVSHFDITDRAPAAGSVDGAARMLVASLGDGSAVPAGELAPVVQLPTADDADQVDPAVVRDLVARSTWSIERVGRESLIVMRLPAGRIERAVYLAVRDTLRAVGGGAWHKKARGFSFPKGDIGNPWAAATPSGRERVSAWLAGDQVDTVPASVSAVPAVTVPAPAAVPAAPAVELPAVPTVEGVPAGMPYVVTMPSGWPVAPVRIEAKEIAKIMRRDFLPAWFPGVTFSARTSHGSMYVGVDVRWTDGPADQVVTLVAEMWRGKFYDGQQEATSYRGAVLYVDAAGNATAYDLPGVSISTHRDVTAAAIDQARPYVPEGDGYLAHSAFSDPFGRPFYGGTREDCARWMAEYGVDQWSRVYRGDTGCPVVRCWLKAGHPHGAVHRNDYGRAFLDTMPADGDGGNGGGGEPVDPEPIDQGPTTVADDAPASEPAGESFGTWADLAAHIGAGRPAPVDQVDAPAGHGYICKKCAGPSPVGVGYVADGSAAAAASAAVTVCQCGNSRTAWADGPYGQELAEGASPVRLVTVTVDGAGEWRIHSPGCRDIKRDTDGRGSAWDVNTGDVRTVVVENYGEPEQGADWRELANPRVMPCAGELPEEADQVDPCADAPAVPGQCDQGPTVQLSGPVAVADLVPGDRVQVTGLDLFGKVSNAAGYVQGSPSPVTIAGRTTAGRRSKDPKKSRPGLLVSLAENPNGWNGWRMTIVTEPAALAERVTDAAHQYRPQLVTVDGSDAVHGRCTCGTYEAPAAPSTWGAGRMRWEQHAAPTSAAPTVAEITVAEVVGLRSYRDGIPVDAPGEAPEVTELAARYPGAGADTIRAAYRTGYAKAAERGAVEAVDLVAHAEQAAATAQELADRVPAAQEVADIQRNGAESAALTLASRTGIAADALRAAGMDSAATITPRAWVTAHVPAEAPAPAEPVDAPAEPVTSASVAAEAPAAPKLRKRPAVGDYIDEARHGLCLVTAVHGRGGEDLTVKAADGRKVDVSRSPRGLWSVVAAPASAGDQVDTDEPADDVDAGSIYRLPTAAYAPELASDDDAELTISHDHANGTTLDGGARGDGTLEIAQRFRFQWRRHAGVHIPHSRDNFADLVTIGKLAAALREAGHTVAVDIDDVWRPAAEREGARAERAEARTERLDERAGRQFAEADSRRLAARRVADGMPFGEPVKIGHHSERAHRAAFDRIERNDRASYAARDYAQHLAARADGAARNEAAKHNPRAIMRRVETLKTDRRAWLRRLADTDKGTTGYARTCRLYVERISEDIAYQVAKLGDLAAAGAFVAWSAETVQRDDVVNVGGSWRTVARINRKGVSVRGLYQWHDGDTITPVTWDQIHGRRRDGMQLDTPNGAPWPIAYAERIERWASLVSRYETCTSYDNTAEERAKRAHVAFARRIVLGLRPMASAQEVAAYGEPTDTEGRRARALASLAIFDRLEAGEKTPEVRASVTPIGDTVPAWTMPAGEPVDVLPANLVPGDIVAGVVDGFSTMRTLSTSIVGPVQSVPRKEDRRESGDWYHVTINGEACELRSSRWLKVHRRTAQS
jgi:hypothetical protein